MGTCADLLGSIADLPDHAGQGIGHLVEAARQLADFVMAGERQARAQVACAQGFGLAYQVAQWAQLAAQ